MPTAGLSMWRGIVGVFWPISLALHEVSVDAVIDTNDTANLLLHMLKP